MQIKRSAGAIWNGMGKDGQGVLSTQSKILNNTPYSFNSRFGEGKGTNPEELLGAAHAGCFSMKLAFNLQSAGFNPEEILTTSVIILENGSIPEVELETKVKCKGISQEKFDELIIDAKENCPVSKLFNTKISLKSSLL